MSQTIFMSNVNDSLHEIVAWASNRELPGISSSQNQQQQQQQQQQSSTQTTATFTVRYESNTSGNNNRRTEEVRDNRRGGSSCRLTPVLPGLITFFSLSVGIVCLVFYFAAKKESRNDLLISGLVLLILGLIVTCLREWLCKPNTSDWDCQIFAMNNRSDSPSRPRDNMEAADRSMCYNNGEGDNSFLPAYSSLVFEPDNRHRSQSSLFKVRLDSRGGSMQNVSGEKFVPPPEYAEVLKLEKLPVPAYKSRENLMVIELTTDVERTGHESEETESREEMDVSTGHVI